ncbi:uncharacterized protein BO88DRAFT_66742 [Aspergillus vadensis CBS 113365]|uniref:Uncharacterized protein n=1 Tax=Aspergillus vadensis (strain CBS 113365 / IMI 142717 / IBT 24658) TaxID=1448311 RepID=A0A319B771_ASPVC|nr:hypothetical protein BO88DRAFT_66742 [Aspergillus vadensis CBS 113365]PYH68199.1 hypothetical protein BO88DRAFT_66742 [Aspergillus vadensis CBS 113365]
MDSRLIPIQHPCCCLEIGLPTKQVRTVFTPNGTGFIVAYPHVAHNGLMLLPVHSLFALPIILSCLTSICLPPLPPWAPLGPEKRSRHPDRCPLGHLIGSRTRLSGYPVPVDRLGWHYYGVQVKKGIDGCLGLTPVAQLSLAHWEIDEDDFRVNSVIWWPSH